MATKIFLHLGLAIGLLAACGERDVILPGERFDIRDTPAFENEARKIALPAAKVNADWTHRNGDAQHRISNPALNANLTQVFAVPIGAGESRRARITADPVVSSGVIYTMDSQSTVTATSSGGATVWSRDLTPVNDNSGDASGGGLAISGGRLFVTTGFGEVSALDAANGATIWEQDLDAPGRSSPTVANGLVYLVSRDGTAWAIDAENGRVQWQLSGTPSLNNFSGGAGPAVTDGIAIFPFASGDVLAAFPEGGLRRWASVVAGERKGSVAATISDISGDPVIDGSRVYIGSFSGRVVALNVDNGDRIWTATEGAVSPVWPEGGSLFLVNDLNELVRLDAADGQPVWRVALPNFVETRLRKTRTVYAHYGPIMAGRRLIVASSDGQLRQFDPVSGALLGALPIAGGAATAPVVANGTLYVVSKDGQLLAFR